MTIKIKYPAIEDIEEYQGGSLNFLKKFYKEVWAKSSSYGENDKKLYEIFKKEHDEKEFIIETRVLLLDYMYGTQIKSVLEIIDIIRDKKPSEGFKSDSVNNMLNEVKIKKQTNPKIRYETSFFTKYCHWYNEVNNKEPMPIYDKNVRVGLSIYNGTKDFECARKESSKIKYDSDSFGKEIKKFMENLDLLKLLQNGKIDLGDGFPKQVSVYRLVDKFLWLMYKIKINADNQKRTKEQEEIEENYRSLWRNL